LSERPEASKRESLDDIIGHSAVVLADQIQKAAAWSKSEMDLQIEVAGALNVSLETVENLIVERTLKLYNPRITERSLMNFCRRNGSLINWEFIDGETRDWLRSSMGFDRSSGVDAAARLNPFLKHAQVVRKCTECGRSIRGNVFFRHLKGCKSSKSPRSEPGLHFDRSKK